MVMAAANDFEDFITCGVCLCEYDDLNRKPKFLQCSARHTVCLMCLRKIIKNATISCPFCCENFHVADVARLPKNGYVLHMLEFREQKGNKPINKKVPNLLGSSVCPTCGSGIKSDAGINLLATAIEKQKEAQKQLEVVMKSIQAAEEDVKKLQEENDFKLTQMVSVMEVKDNFVLKNSSVFILRIFQFGQLKGDIHIRPKISRATTHFLKKLGDFCYKSPTNFNSTVDKAMQGVFVLLSMENLQFQPDASDINNFTVEQACDYGEVGITSIYSVGNKVTEWSLVFILEDNERFSERDNLPEDVSNDCELIGRVGCFDVLEQTSRVRKSERANYTFTLESR